jgi:hypothetical protein
MRSNADLHVLFAPTHQDAIPLSNDCENNIWCSYSEVMEAERPQPA